MARRLPGSSGSQYEASPAGGMIAGAPRGILDQLLEPRQAPPGLANRIVSGTGDVDSAQLAQRMWVLGRIVAADERLGAAFGEGLDRIAERTAETDLQPAIDAFLADHGHRGNDAGVLDHRPVVDAALPRRRRGGVRQRRGAKPRRHRRR